MSALDEYDRKAMETISRHGWMVQGVGAGEDSPGFHYTVGLTLERHPEIITFGLPYQMGGTILNSVADLLRSGKRIEHGSIRRDVIQNFPVEFVRVDEEQSRDHLTMAHRLLSGGVTPVVALQMVWPDAQGRFPWDEGFDYGDAIPLLGTRATITVITEDQVDEYVCPTPGCGNTPYTDGFYACDESGEDVEPDESWGGLYRCAACGAKHRIEAA